MTTFPFNEQNLSQIPALQQLISPGYEYLTPPRKPSPEKQDWIPAFAGICGWKRTHKPPKETQNLASISRKQTFEMKQQRPSSPHNLYMFVDESGNFDFSPNGTKFFTLTCVTTERPFKFYKDFDNYKYGLFESGFPKEYFHCSGDNRHIRSAMFGIIKGHLTQFRIDSIVIEKNKTNPNLREPTKFYSKMLNYLLAYTGRFVKPEDKITIITDAIPVKDHRKAIAKAIKGSLAKSLSGRVQYQIVHHATKSHYGLQLVDYCSWSIFNKWERNKDEHYKIIEPSVKTEFDIFRSGTERHY